MALRSGLAAKLCWEAFPGLTGPGSPNSWIRSQTSLWRRTGGCLVSTLYQMLVFFCSKNEWMKCSEIRVPPFFHQVQQRGVEATKSIILSLLSGMGSGNPKDPVLLVDLMPSRPKYNLNIQRYGVISEYPKKVHHGCYNLNIQRYGFRIPSRFSEWGFACWDLQRAALTNEPAEGQTWDVHYLGLYDDAQQVQSAASAMTGRAMAQWWDQSVEAGPRSRPNAIFHGRPTTVGTAFNFPGEQGGSEFRLKLIDITIFNIFVINFVWNGNWMFSPDRFVYFVIRIPEIITQKYQATHSEQLKALQDKLDEEVTIANAVKAFGTTSTQTSSNQPGATGARTAASPDWAGSPPWNFRKRFTATPISLADFENQRTLLVLWDSCFFLMLFWSQRFITVFHVYWKLSTLNLLRIDAMAVLAREQKLQVAVTTLGNLWLVNRTPNQVELSHGELFGFNVGSFCELQSGLKCWNYCSTFFFNIISTLCSKIGFQFCLQLCVQTCFKDMFQSSRNCISGHRLPALAADRGHRLGLQSGAGRWICSQGGGLSCRGHMPGHSWPWHHWSQGGWPPTSSENGGLKQSKRSIFFEKQRKTHLFWSAFELKLKIIAPSRASWKRWKPAAAGIQILRCPKGYRECVQATGACIWCQQDRPAAIGVRRNLE